MSTDTVKDAAPIRLVFELAPDHPCLYDDLIQFQKGTKRVNRLRVLAYDGLLAQSGVSLGWDVARLICLPQVARRRAMATSPTTSSRQRSTREPVMARIAPAGEQPDGQCFDLARWAAANGWWCSSISMDARAPIGSGMPVHGGWSSMSSSIGKVWRLPRRPPGRALFHRHLRVRRCLADGGAAPVQGRGTATQRLGDAG